MNKISHPERAMRLLAVDDNPFSLDLIPRLFPPPEFGPVSVATSATQALGILERGESRFDCLLLDIEMPGMDGIELCRRIRAMPEHRTTPIIMLTARDDIETIEQVFAAGANDHLVKRSGVKEFTGRVRVAERLLRSDDTYHVKRYPLVKLPADDQVRRGEHPFRLEDAVTISGLDRLILSFSLGNYLTQLDRTELNRCKLFCASIEDIELLYRDTTTRELTAALAAVAEGIARSAQSERLLMAYSGAGHFACVVRETELPDADTHETDIARHLRTMARRTGIETLRGVRVSVGSASTPCANRTQRVRRSFERANERLAVRLRQRMVV